MISNFSVLEWKHTNFFQTAIPTSKALLEIPSAAADDYERCAAHHIPLLRNPRANLRYFVLARPTRSVPVKSGQYLTGLRSSLQPPSCRTTPLVFYPRSVSGKQC